MSSAGVRRPARDSGRNGSSVPQRLLAESTRLFAEKGYESTSVQEIVDAAGVTKGALYHYYGSKEDLLYEIYGRLLRHQIERLEQIAVADLPVAERVHAAARDMVESTLANLDDARIFFRSLHQISPAKQEEVRKERRQYGERLGELIKEGQASGIFVDGEKVPIQLRVYYFIGAVHHLGIWYRPDGALPAPEIARLFADMFLDSLMARPTGTWEVA
jgi:AcrR family transcriptional regulator